MWKNENTKKENSESRQENINRDQDRHNDLNVL